MNTEEELLVITMEECAELSQACAKILRFGRNKKSISQLKYEIGDVAAMLTLFLKYGWLTGEEMDAGIAKKMQKLSKWSQLPLDLKNK